MGDSAPPKKPTLKTLTAAVRRLQGRDEDMEDLMELRAAAKKNAGKPGIPWKQVKTDLRLD